MEKISLNKGVRNEETLHTGKERNIPNTINKKEGCLDWSHIASEMPSETVITRKIEGKMEETGGEEEDVSNYWMTLRKILDTEI
jgi:hypothetical protein